MSKRLIFFGNERLATGLPAVRAATLRALIHADYEIVAVLSRPSKLIDSDLEQLCREHDIPLLAPRSKDQLQQMLAPYQAEAGILEAFGLIVPPAVIDHFPRGIINLHPSLLPHYRGPTPIESAMLDGTTDTGISIMQLTAEMDTGPVYAQQSVSFDAHASKVDWAETMQQRGSDLLIDSLPAILSGELQPTPQDDSRATYSQLIMKADGLIDWHKSATRIEREIRAYLGWPGSRTTLLRQELIITEAQVADAALSPGECLTQKDRLLVGTGQDALEVLRLKPAGKSEMSAADWLRGHKK